MARPSDLAAALDLTPTARSAFDQPEFSLKRKQVATIEDVKSPQFRQRRIGSLVATLESRVG
jgi:uncharacterized protein YdeI (YjbR/CyaY-like superfamily)